MSDHHIRNPAPIPSEASRNFSLQIAAMLCSPNMWQENLQLADATAFLYLLSVERRRPHSICNRPVKQLAPQADPELLEAQNLLIKFLYFQPFVMVFHLFAHDS
jgi:hypothetical protein